MDAGIKATQATNGAPKDVPVKEKTENGQPGNVKYGYPVNSTSNRGYKKEDVDKDGSTSLLFSMDEQVGALARALRVFEKHNVNLMHIESRPSRQTVGQYDFFVSCDDTKGGLNAATEDLKKITNNITILSRNTDDNVDSGLGTLFFPWFPRKIQELDRFANQILSYGSELDADHPGFTDPVYRARRKEFADIAFNYKHGQQIPRVKYTKAEVETWGTMFRELTKLFPTHACREFNHVWPLLVDNCGYREDNIPQLQDISDFLKG